MFFAASNRSDSTDNEATAHSSDSPSNAGASTATQHGRRRHQHHRRPGQINFENFLQEILISISDGANVGSGQSMFFMGNPGDYAWGREGLDQIVTQLLNQMDNSGWYSYILIRFNIKNLFLDIQDLLHWIKIKLRKFQRWKSPLIKWVLNCSAPFAGKISNWVKLLENCHAV